MNVETFKKTVENLPLEEEQKTKIIDNSLIYFKFQSHLKEKMGIDDDNAIETIVQTHMKTELEKYVDDSIIDEYSSQQIEEEVINTVFEKLCEEYDFDGKEKLINSYFALKNMTI